MNFYNPYMNMMPYINAPARIGIFSRLFRNGFSFSSLLSGTQKTLNFINQAIPAVRNVSPIIKNAKTMFKVMNEIRKPDNSFNLNKTNSKNVKINNESNVNINSKKNNVPTFFI